jgi:hypothetical protein
MGIYEFNLLKQHKQIELVWDRAVFLINRLKEDYGLSLYKLFDFYVEIHLNNGTNSIEKVRTFKNIEPLAPYLDEIDAGIK